MQQIGIRALSYDRATSKLSQEASTLTGQLDLSKIICGREPFEIQGARETKMYGYYREVRENEPFVLGDTLHWEFRPINALGKYQPGPLFLIIND